MADAAADDWLASTVIEPAAAFDGVADQVLGAGVPQAAFLPARRTAETLHWRMRDVTYVHNPGRAFRAGVKVAPTCRAVSMAPDDAVIARWLAGPREAVRDARVFCGTNRLNQNYYHQLVDIIPAVASYAADPGFADGLLLGPNAGSVPMLRAALALAGVAPPPLLAVSAIPRDFDDLTFCSLLNGDAGPSRIRLSVYDRMIAGAAAAEAVLDPPRAIYVWRADSAARPMRNEDALVERLEALGVMPVLLSGLTLAEQIRLFQAAPLVIGPHGAGLANVVFARAGAVLYELFPSHFIDACMARLAWLRGVHYWCDVHPAEPRPGLAINDTPWSVDIDAVVRQVETILARYDRG